MRIAPAPENYPDKPESHGARTEFRGNVGPERPGSGDPVGAGRSGQVPGRPGTVPVDPDRSWPIPAGYGSPEPARGDFRPGRPGP